MRILKQTVEKIPLINSHAKSSHANWVKRKQDRVLAGAAQILERFSKPYKINAGCGSIYFDGWVNIDFDPEQPQLDVQWDVSQSLPVPNKSCDVIYCLHMLEHLSVDQGQQFLRECRRALTTGGTLRIAMPSLDDLIEKCVSGQWRDRDWLKTPEWQHVETKAEMMNVIFRTCGHQWIYNGEELHRRLHQAGFKTIKDVAWGQSDVPLLQNRDTRTNSILLCEATKQ